MNNDVIQRPKSNNLKVEMKNPNYFQERYTLSARPKNFNDYRQKHPETIPRRGRRIRTALSQCETKISAGGVLNLSNVALGSGAQVRQNPSGADVGKDVGLVINNSDELRKENVLNTDSTSHTDSTSFKDMLAQFAKLSQAERQEILHNAVKPPPPYPEVTVHPVPTTSASNSLLHGILTKNQTKAESKSTFSPTLARLLTAPEKNSPQTSTNHGSGVASITDILCNTKARNEITITPVIVIGQYDTPSKGKTNQVEEDETEDSVDRLVIDESSEVVDARSKDNNSDIGDEVPQCQGCNQKPAQFVCAGCANQWYCSRDCQVSAWDEHSEVCSG
ncbi:MYND finger [Popillia japonica]|uniref:MYND finger n=1 Tax=Popillia japonica TaxID=7064 RepID=A0AAW1JST4_POPJA